MMASTYESIWHQNPEEQHQSLSGSHLHFCMQVTGTFQRKYIACWFYMVAPRNGKSNWNKYNDKTVQYVKTELNLCVNSVV